MMIQADRLGRRAMLFTMDAMLASMVLIAGLLLISKFLVKEPARESIEFLSSDVLSCLAELEMSDINATFVNEHLASNSTDMNLSVLEQLGTYWASGETALAINLSDYLLRDFFHDNTGINIIVGNSTLFEKSTSMQSDVFSGDRMITGVLQGAPITGSTSSAYLRRITDKRTKSFAYFGGFVGQGNISISLSIPDDVDSSDISRIILELDAASNFTIMINNANCKQLSSAPGNMSPERWNLSECNGSILHGDNNISLVFTGDLSNAYVAGGYLRVDYKTDHLQGDFSATNSTYVFPEIRGVVNLYDSFYVPGNLTSMTLYLHYLANHSIDAFNNTFYLTVGNKTIFTDIDSTTEQFITRDNTQLSALLNYSELNGKTVPFRMGFENLTYAAQLIGNSQVILITDVSGSMEWEMDSNSDGERRNCNSSDINDSDTTRLSVAKCLDKTFVYNVLNISGNRMGAVSYSTSTRAGTISLTTNYSVIDAAIGTSVPQTGYYADGSTCICCGINSAKTELTRDVRATPLINKTKSWLYTTNSFNGVPANDSSGYAWWRREFNDSSWPSGNAILGHNVTSTGTVVATELSSRNTTIGVAYANLWEHSGDVAGPPNDFTSNLINSTANTFGWSGSNDGWDWAGGASAYGYSSTVNFLNVTGGRLTIDVRTGSPLRNRCSNYDCSGAYGITVNITQEMIDFLNQNGSATLTFNYEWAGNSGNPFSDSDQVWIKGKWIEPGGTEHWLGSNVDTLHNNGDSDPEIAAADNPDQDFSGFFLANLRPWITNPGLYYLHFGGKLRSSDSDEWGVFYFDNVQIMISNHTDAYYFRKHFNVTDTNFVKRGVLNILSDDIVNIYLNGNAIFSGTDDLNGTYWDRRGIFVDGSYFRAGDNVVAVELLNKAADAKFDLELIGINKTEQGAMLVMTDGQANEECAAQGTGDAVDDAIKAACDAREDYGIQVFAVGFSTEADEDALSGMAKCGEGIYAKSDNVSALSDFYNDVVVNIISASIKSQTIIISGGTSASSNLYKDSYLFYSYTPVVENPQPNEISVEMQTDQFNSCNPVINIPLGIRIADAKVTSYSGDHWTKLLSINSTNVYNLTQYSSEYIRLGDPFIIHIPAYLVANGSNSISLDTGDEPFNSTGCSPNNTLIYTALVPSSTTRSEVVERTDGCKWIIQFEDDTFSNKSIPASYFGSKRCSYTSTNHTLATGSYDPADAYDIAVYHLLQSLDFDDNGKVFVNLDAEDIEIVITTVSSVPYLWGPTLVKARVWQ